MRCSRETAAGLCAGLWLGTLSAGAGCFGTADVPGDKPSLSDAAEGLDGGARDAADSGSLAGPDAGPQPATDAGLPPQPDSGSLPEVDAGSPQESDAGSGPAADAGAIGAADAGPTQDAGSIDAADAADAGEPEADAGDAGGIPIADAGSQSGADAGPSQDAGQAPGVDAGTGPSQDAGVDPSTSAWLQEHNAVRAAAQPPPSPALSDLTWSSSAASVAAAWAQNCTWAHNANRGPYGENIAASTAPLTPASVVDMWAAEAADYKYATNQCSDVCGHYTQLVWRSTTAVGCAIQRCDSGSPFPGGGPWYFAVCDYSPPGNYIGQKPY